MNESLTTSIIASVIAVAIVTFINQVWIKIILPWYENHLYKGVEISGDWEAEILYPKGEHSKLVISIHRVGYSVNGSGLCIDGPNKGQKWKFLGSFRNNILTITYDSSNRREIDRGSGSFALTNNGRSFVGGIFYYDEDDNTIHSYETTFHFKDT